MSLNKNSSFHEYFSGSTRNSEKFEKTDADFFLEKYVIPMQTQNSLILNVESAVDFQQLNKMNAECFNSADSHIEYAPKKIYDTVICGKNLLHCIDPMHALDSFGNVLRSGGLLILEFENSNAVDLLFKKSFNKKAAFIHKSSLENQKMWYYSDSWINELLSLNGFEIIRRHKFHYSLSCNCNVTSNRLLRSQSDSLLRAIPIVKNLASNTIMLCRKKLN